MKNNKLVILSNNQAHTIQTIIRDKLVSTEATSVISVNNVVNRKMFIELSGTGRLVPYIQNPINVDEQNLDSI